MSACLNTLLRWSTHGGLWLYQQALPLRWLGVALSLALLVAAVVLLRRHAHVEHPMARPLARLMALTAALLLAQIGILQAGLRVSITWAWVLIGAGCLVALAWPGERPASPAPAPQSDDTPPADTPDDGTATTAPSPRNRLPEALRERGPRLALLGLLLTAAACVYGHRLMDAPGEMRAYGSQAMVQAQMMFDGTGAWRDMILYHEMTQEECNHSLPFVLWNMLFQGLCGGMSIFSARLAATTAGLLLLVLLYRVGGKLFSPRFGLLCVLGYAFLPTAVYNARNELYFGFSLLLLLLLMDIVTSYVKRPTWPRAIALGLLTPLAGYGLANIRIMFVAVLGYLALCLARERPLLRASLTRLPVAALLTLTLLLPQMLNWDEVRRNVKGRGEHLFGAFFPQYHEHHHPDRPMWRTATELLDKNARFLTNKAMSGYPYHTSLPIAFTGSMLIGLALCLRNAHRPAYGLLLLFWLGSYFGPMIAFWASDVRVQLLGPAQIMTAMLPWFELGKRLRRVPATLIATPVVVMAMSGLGGMHYYLETKHPLPELRNHLAQREEPALLFLYTNLETGLNFMRWNPPVFGRDSVARFPVIGLRRQNMAQGMALADFLRCPVILATQAQWASPIRETARAAGYHYQLLENAQYVLLHNDTQGRAAFWVEALNTVRPWQRGEQHTQLFYRGALLYTAYMPAEGFAWHVEIPHDLERMAIMVRAFHRTDGDIWLRAEINGGATLLRLESPPPPADSDLTANSAWAPFHAGLQRGSYTLHLTQQLMPDHPPVQPQIEEVLLLGTLAE